MRAVLIAICLVALVLAFAWADGHDDGKNKHEPNLLGDLVRFNLFAFGCKKEHKTVNMTRGDCGGRVAVKGNARFDTFGIGDQLDCQKKHTDPKEATLIVTGNLDYTNGQLFCGSFFAGTVTSAPSLGQPGAGRLDKNPVDFKDEKKKIRETENELCKKNGKCADNDGFYGFTFNGNNDAIQEFSIKVSEINKATSIKFNIPNKDAIIIILVIGDEDKVTFSNFGVDTGGHDPRRILWVFCHVEDIVINGFQFPGSLLASKSELELDNGEVQGSIIIGCVKGCGGGECKFFPFKGKRKDCFPSDP